MSETTERVDQFKAEIAGLRVKDPTPARDVLLLRVGAVAMVAGVVAAIIAYTLSHGTTNPLDQRDDLVIAVIGLAVTVLGAALWLRYSVAGFLRFWLARLIYEQRAQTDRLLER